MKYKFTRQEVIQWLEENNLINIKPIKDILLSKKDYYGELMNEIESQKIMMEQVSTPSLLNDIETIEEIDLSYYVTDMEIKSFINSLIKNQRILIEIIKSLMEVKNER